MSRPADLTIKDDIFSAKRGSQGNNVSWWSASEGALRLPGEKARISHLVFVLLSLFAPQQAASVEDDAETQEDRPEAEGKAHTVDDENGLLSPSKTPSKSPKSPCERAQ